MNYVISVLILATIWVVLVASLNLLAGFTGLFSLAHIGFMAVGAYTVGVLTTTHGLNFFAGLGVAIIVAIILGIAIGYTTLRFRGHRRRKSEGHNGLRIDLPQGGRYVGIPHAAVN